MREVIFKIFVARYYSTNAGFFLFFFLLLFGIVDAPCTIYFHYSIMHAAAHSLPVLALLCGVWLLYGIKCAGFMAKVIGDPANTMLCELQALPPRRQYRQMLGVQFSLFFPVFVYAAITAGVAAHEQCYLALATIIVFLAALFHFSAKLYLRQLQYHSESIWTKYLPAIAKRKKERNLNLMLLHLSLSKHKKTLLVLKIASLVFLQALVAFNKEHLSKESVCFFMMIIIAAHAMLPYYYVRFTEQQTPWLRNMPFSLTKRFALYAVAYALLFVPEVSFLLLHVHYAIPVVIILCLFLLALGQLSFFTALLYMPRMREERYMLWVLVVFISSMLLLAGVHIGIYALALSIVAFALFTVRYERYELKGEKHE